MSSKSLLSVTLVAGLVLGACNSSTTDEETSQTSNPPAQESAQVAVETIAPAPEAAPAQQQPTTTLEAVVMSVPYRITLGRVLSGPETAQVQALIDGTFEEIDNIYNKWNPCSEISRINDAKANSRIPISRALERFLLQCDQVVRLTTGRFDPSVLPLQDLWEKHLSVGNTPERWEIEELEQAIGWDKLHIENGYVTKDHDKTALDLGGVAKGYAVDLLVERLNRAGFEDSLIEWGGEIRTAGQHPEGRPWKIFISRLGSTDPVNAIETLDLSDMALATSGDYAQKWHAQGKEYFHIVDPRTHRALEVTQRSVASASVLAPSCMLADALATAAMLFDNGEEAQVWAEEMQAKLHGTAFWIVTRDGDEQL